MHVWIATDVFPANATLTAFATVKKGNKLVPLPVVSFPDLSTYIFLDELNGWLPTFNQFNRFKLDEYTKNWLFKGIPLGSKSCQFWMDVYNIGSNEITGFTPPVETICEVVPFTLATGCAFDITLDNLP